MRKLLGFPISWLLWGLGDISCRVMHIRDTERWVDVWYPIYNGLMLKSDAVQEWAGGTSRRWPWDYLPLINSGNKETK